MPVESLSFTSVAIRRADW